jgi:hypothetical protein
MAYPPDATAIRVDFLLLADSAQTFGGKVHLLGGGWSQLLLPQVGEASLPFFVVAGIVIPWSMTNTPFELAVEIRDLDGVPLDVIASHEAIEQGRPPGLRPGSDQRVVLALPVRTDEIEAGRYAVVALIDKRESGATTFEIIRR